MRIAELSESSTFRTQLALLPFLGLKTYRGSTYCSVSTDTPNQHFNHSFGDH